jgi:hypothetical protein
LIKVDIESAEYDRMRQSVVMVAGRGCVIVSLEALESYFSRELDADAAVEAAIEAGNIIRLAANATPADDGVTNITSKILNGRLWELNERENEDAD